MAFFIFCCIGITTTAQDCKPAYQNTDDFTQESATGYGGEIVSPKLLTLSGYSVSMSLYVEKNNDQLKAIGSLQLIFDTKNGYELAKDQYLQQGNPLSFYLKLKNGKVLEFSSHNPTLNSRNIGSTHGILITGATPLSSSELVLLQEHHIEKVHYAIGGRAFDKKVKPKTAKKVNAQFQCIEGVKGNTVDTGEIDNEAMKKLAGTWVRKNNKKMKVVFSAKGTFVITVGKKIIKGKYHISNNQFVTRYTYKGKEVNDSETILELTDNMFSIQGKSVVVSYRRVK